MAKKSLKETEEVITPEQETVDVTPIEVTKKELEAIAPLTVIEQIKRDSDCFHSIEETDKQTYATVLKYWQQLRDIRLNIEKARKKFVGPAVAYQREVNDYAKQLTGQAAPTETRLSLMLEEVDKIKEQKRLEAAEAERVAELERQEAAKKKIDGRIAILFGNRMTFNGNVYKLGDIEITPGDVATKSDEGFNNFILLVMEARETLEVQEKEAEDARLAEAKRVKDLQDKAAAADKLIEDMRRERISSREAELLGMGFDAHGVPGFFVWGQEYKVSNNVVQDCEAAEWSEYILTVRADVTKLREAREKAVQEAKAQQAIEDKRKEDAALELAKKRKEEEAAKEKADSEEQHKLEQDYHFAMLADGETITVLRNELEEVYNSTDDGTTEITKRIISSAKEDINSIVEKLNDAIKKDIANQ